MDKRWDKVAELLVNRATNIKKGERVMIAMHETHTESLLIPLVEHIVLAGAYPQIQYLSEKVRHMLLKYGNEEQLTRLPDLENWGMEWADVYIGMRGGFNLGETWDVAQNALALNQVVNGKISKKRWSDTRWCLIRVPSLEMAVEAKISYEELMDNFFDSCFIDWDVKIKEWNILKEKLESGKEMRLVAPNTDLQFAIEGRKWHIFDGTYNLPDGEIATAPITKTIQGYVQFDEPAVLGGRLFPNVRLEWEQGVLVKATSSDNQQLLLDIVHSDSGSSLIGEFAFGLNDGLKHFCKDILLDEKIGGTIHMALGRAYTQCGGTNDSFIHWDMVLDTRKDACVYMDGNKIFEDGVFL